MLTTNSPMAKTVWSARDILCDANWEKLLLTVCTARERDPVLLAEEPPTVITLSTIFFKMKQGWFGGAAEASGGHYPPVPMPWTGPGDRPELFWWLWPSLSPVWMKWVWRWVNEQIKLVWVQSETETWVQTVDGWIFLFIMKIGVKIFPFFTFMSFCCWLLDSAVNWSCRLSDCHLWETEGC